MMQQINPSSLEKRLRPSVPRTILDKEDVISGTLPSPTHFLTITWGIGLYIHFYLGVRLSLSELISPIILLFNSGRLFSLLKYPEFKWLFVLLLLFVAGTLTTDAVLTEIDLDTAKSISRSALVTMSAFTFGSLLLSGSNVMPSALVGMCVGSLLNLFFNTCQDDSRLETTAYSFYVFRIYPFIVCSTCLGGYILGRSGPILPAVLSASGAVSAAVGGSRSLLGICIVLTGLLLSKQNGSRLFSRIRQRPLFACVAIVFFAMLSISAYRLLAGSGWMGEVAQNKYFESVSRGNTSAVEILFDGRTETLAAIKMIFDSPIFGHGSAANSRDYMLSAISEVGRYVTRDTIRENSAGHSVFFNAWAYNGILTVPFWSFVSITFLRLAYQLLRTNSRTCYLILPLTLMSMWSMVFSPLSVQERSIFGFLFAITWIIDWTDSYDTLTSHSPVH